MVCADGVCYFLQQDCLAGPRRSDYQATLTFADRRYKIDDSHVQFFRCRLEHKTVFRMQRRQVAEDYLFSEVVGVFKIDGLDSQKGKIFFGVLGRPDLTRYDISGPQPETPDLRR
ncbi:hypothetical protein ES703_44354 [subsurface metagenome]